MNTSSKVMYKKEKKINIKISQVLIFFWYNINMKYVLFDFNGTIVDDVALSLAAINHAAKKYLKRDEIKIDEYRNVFTFPVKDYYTALGFDFNKINWEEAGKYWYDYYCLHQEEAKLHDGIKETLISNRNKGYKNIVLSASKSDLLNKQLKDLGVYDLFDEILGNDNIYASSKVHIGKAFMKDKDPKDCLMIGDSGHDKEVADAMGIECILIAKGHEAKERLLKVTDKVYDSIKEVNL